MKAVRTRGADVLAQVCSKEGKKDLPRIPPFLKPTTTYRSMASPSI
jgi:hypothetical protein